MVISWDFMVRSWDIYIYMNDITDLRGQLGTEKMVGACEAKEKK